MAKMTISEIAKLAGVSKTTVSRVLNNKPDVLPETRKRIEGLIKQYDFQPNAFAKAISHQRSNTIGLVIPNDTNYIFSNPYYSEIMRGVSIEAKKNGYHLMITYSEGDDYISVVKQKRVDGIILISPGAEHSIVVEQLKKLNIPFVSSSRIPGVEDANYVCTDDFGGAKSAVEHLILQGHRRIGFINGIKYLGSSEDRLDGYKFMLEKHNILYDSNIVINGDGSIESGHKVMQKFIQDEGITAIFAASDLMAAGAISAIIDKKKSVPENISVVGYDDIPLAGFLSPPLTTIRQPIFEKGCIATKMLIDIIRGKSSERNIKLPAQIVIRKSTRRI